MMSENTAKALEVRHLSVSFGGNKVFGDLNFDVEEGSALAIIGPNGSGKTVLLKVLAGLLPCEGKAKWKDGTRFGYVPQKLDLQRDLPVTGRDYLDAVARMKRCSEAEMADVLENVGIPSGIMDSLIGTLSGGQFQRLLVASALIGRPNTLLLDEATAGIDEPGQERIQEIIRRLRKESKLTVLFISHELRIVSRSADNVLCLMRDAAFTGPPRQILTPDLLSRLYGSEIGLHIHDHD